MLPSLFLDRSCCFLERLSYISSFVRRRRLNVFMHMAHLVTWLRQYKTHPAGKRPRTRRMWLLLSLGLLAFLGWCLLHPATTQPGAWASSAPFSLPGPITVGRGRQAAGRVVSN